MADTYEALPARPPYDSATAALLERIEPLGVFRAMTVENIPSWRAPVDEVRAGFLVRHPDVDLEDADVVRDDGTSFPVAIVRSSRDVAGGRPGPLFLSLHGGGLIMGCRFNGLLTVVPWLRRYGGVIVSPEYRLAPESPAPAGVEDCYATLCWVVEHAEALGADPDRVVVVGPSAGGGLSAGTLLMARDRQGPAVLGGLLDYPMLDDRTGLPGWQGSVSARQYPDDGTWPTAYNDVAWEAALGERRGTELVTPYEAPARAAWLGGLPPLFVSVASAEVFRDEDVAFASRVWHDGGDAELHVYPGGTHAMEFVNARWLAQGLTAARDLWMERLLHPEDPRLNVAAVAQAGTYPALTEELFAARLR
ncbi:alpha/beta hydrolase [Actinomyces viscosus]|uniref:alpha/beta hydrolase n=1 Tax=Actinomyces viscosus TaxID=1656 RepID=UPI0028F0B7F4|nr:alpha/beta hydrolase [Actinomyces viscosus]